MHASSALDHSAADSSGRQLCTSKLQPNLLARNFRTASLQPGRRRQQQVPARHCCAAKGCLPARASWGHNGGRLARNIQRGRNLEFHRRATTAVRPPPRCPLHAWPGCPCVCPLAAGETPGGMLSFAQVQDLKQQDEASKPTAFDEFTAGSDRKYIMIRCWGTRRQTFATQQNALDWPPAPYSQKPYNLTTMHRQARMYSLRTWASQPSCSLSAEMHGTLLTLQPDTLRCCSTECQGSDAISLHLTS